MSAANKINIHHPFMDGVIIQSLANGVVEALKIMVNIEASFEKPFVGTNWKSPTDFSVYLNLNSDFYRGRIQFHFTEMVAKTIVEKLIGSEVIEKSEILDGVGEISNIFYGGAKTKLNSLGLNLAMSLPKPCLTKDLPKAIAETTCMLIPFKVLGEICYVEIILN
ncbi:MAG: chemotaxis protein CheX [Bdellovibrionaceae bacterium]|nr:chemotaxis protein CheX [Bdellovibrio sp.]